MLKSIDRLTQVPETTLSYASVMGLQSDIGLTGDQYQWLGSIFYFGEPCTLSNSDLSRLSTR